MIHTAQRADPDRKEPPIHSGATATDQKRMRAIVARSWEPAGLPKTANRLRKTWSATYEQANSAARPSNAPGIAIAIRRLASMTTISTARTTGESGSNQFVIHVV